MVTSIALLAMAVSLISLAVSVSSLLGRTENPHSSLLGRECVVTVGNRSYLATVVAVSWKGAVAVRGRTPGTTATRWIDRRHVDRQVRWLG